MPLCMVIPSARHSRHSALFLSLTGPTMGPWTHCKLGSATLACPAPVEYPVGRIELVEFWFSLPKQDKEELTMLVGMYPVEWDLPRQDKEELMMLLGISLVEREKRVRQERKRLVKAEEAQLRPIVS